MANCSTDDGKIDRIPGTRIRGQILGDAVRCTEKAPNGAAIVDSGSGHAGRNPGHTSVVAPVCKYLLPQASTVVPLPSERAAAPLPGRFTTMKNRSLSIGAAKVRAHVQPANARAAGARPSTIRGEADVPLKAAWRSGSSAEFRWPANNWSDAHAPPRPSIQRRPSQSCGSRYGRAEACFDNYLPMVGTAQAGIGSSFNGIVMSTRPSTELKCSDTNIRLFQDRWWGSSRSSRPTWK